MKLVESLIKHGECYVLHGSVCDWSFVKSWERMISRETAVERSYGVQRLLGRKSYPPSDERNQGSLPLFAFLRCRQDMCLNIVDYTKRSVWTSCLGSYSLTVNFCSASALSSGYYHCKRWMIKRKGNQKVLWTSTIHHRVCCSCTELLR